MVQSSGLNTSFYQITTGKMLMITNLKISVCRSAVAALALVLLAGCSTAPATVDTTGEATFDGLYPVKGGRMDEAWARPDTDLTVYTKVMLEGAGVEFRPGGKSGKFYSDRMGRTRYEVSPGEIEAFKVAMGEAFTEELAKSELFTIVDEVGPDVLLVTGELLDVVSYIPAHNVGGMNATYLTQVGEATLVLELRDSITQTILVRGVDRKAAENSGQGMTQAAISVSTSSEFRRLARIWAQLLRTGLESLMVPGETAVE
jgi:hypothetical protein